MYREVMAQLREWQKSDRRKPLVLRGARQVGKTWLLQNFGMECYESVVYLNMDGDENLKKIFDKDFDIIRIIGALENYAEQKIEQGKTLLIFDEIQEVPRALESLKYFYEKAPEYHIAVAGSLLGVALHEGTSFPVGKVNFIDVLPMSFYEFLLAIGKEPLAKLIKSGDPEGILPFHEKLLGLFYQYVLVGGMPEVVSTYVADGNLLRIREVQNEILESYEQDFSKHAPLNVVPRIREIFEILPKQLVKENKKFIFNLIREGARAKEYEAALLWLEDAGIVRRVTRVNAAKNPISAYAEHDIFKLFMLDIGLFGAKANLSFNSILYADDLLIEFKGAVAEQAIFQMLREEGHDIYYYANNESRGEIDFMIEDKGAIVPIEVKSGSNLQSRSLNSFLQKNTAIMRAVKYSILPYNKNERIVNYPIYLSCNNP